MDRKFNPQEATSAILLSIIASDGEISDEEVAAFNAVAVHHPIMVDQPAAAFHKMMDEQLTVLRKQGWEVLFDEGARELPVAMTNTVFVLAVDFVLSDGTVEETEERLIGKLRDALSISNELVNASVEVLSINYGVK